MIVYRFETPKGVGAFGCGAAAAYDRAIDRKHSAYDPPGPGNAREEGSPLHKHALSSSLAGYHFGFASKAQIKRWFRSIKGRRAMEAHGCFLYAYEVDPYDVLHGHWQVIFKRDQAHRLGRLTPDTLQPLYQQVGEAA